MQKPQKHNAPVSLKELNQKLDFESKRLIREREDGVIKRVSKAAVLNGNSTLIFKNINGATVTLSYRLDASGNLRFAHEKQFDKLAQEGKATSVASVGRTSGDIGK